MTEGDPDRTFRGVNEKVLQIVYDLAERDFGSRPATELRLSGLAWRIAACAWGPDADPVWRSPARMAASLRALRGRLWHTRNLLDALNPTAARLAAEATPAFAQALELAKTNPDALDEVEPPHVAAVAALDRTIAALDAPIGLATRMAAEAPGAGRGRNRMAVEVAWMAWRCFEDVTGEEPRPGGGEPTTRYRQFLSRLFEALCIKADTRRPAQAAARRAHAKKTAFAGR